MNKRMVNNVNEVWLPIKGYEGLYEVSNLGRVRSLNYNHTGKVCILKTHITRTGYIALHLSVKGVKVNLFVHRIVYETFIGEIPEGLTVNHINEIKSDNRPENLNLMTRSEQNSWGTRLERVSNKQKNNYRSKKIMCVETGIIYPSINEAVRQMKTLKQNIRSCLSGKSKTSCGYHWQYIN